MTNLIEVKILNPLPGYTYNVNTTPARLKEHIEKGINVALEGSYWVNVDGSITSKPKIFLNGEEPTAEDCLWIIHFFSESPDPYIWRQIAHFVGENFLVTVRDVIQRRKHEVINTITNLTVQIAEYHYLKSLLEQNILRIFTKDLSFNEIAYHSLLAQYGLQIHSEGYVELNDSWHISCTISQDPSSQRDSLEHIDQCIKHLEIHKHSCYLYLNTISKWH